MYYNSITRALRSGFFVKSALVALSVLGYGLFVFAAAPTGGYIPGQILDPNCAPGDIDCVVNLYITTNPTYTWTGVNAGQNGGSTDNTVFIGIGAGDGASAASYSNFIGTGAGQNATNANNSNFMGEQAGYQATNAISSIFLGRYSGREAALANNSFFIRNQSGLLATNARQSNFFGNGVGKFATYAESSQFYETLAGQSTTNAAHSIFIEENVGFGNMVDNRLGSTSILIGKKTSTGGFSNSTALVTYATNTASSQFVIDSISSPWINDVLINGFCESIWKLKSAK